MANQTPTKKRRGRPPKDPNAPAKPSKSKGMRVMTFRIDEEMYAELQAFFANNATGARTVSEMLRLMIQQWMGTPEQVMVTREVAADIRMILKPALALVMQRVSEVVEDELPAIIENYYIDDTYAASPARRAEAKRSR